MIIIILDVFSFHLVVFRTLKLIVSKNISHFLSLLFFVLFCLNATEPSYRLVPYLF